MKKQLYPPFRELKGRMEVKEKSQTEMSKELGISLHSFNKKINGFRDFKYQEMYKIIEVLEISKDEISKYFFDML